MKSSPPAAIATSGKLDPVTVGVLLSVISAALYAATNVCLRLSSDHDPLWVTFLKTAPTSLIAGGLCLFASRRGATMWPGWRNLVAIALVGLLAQWGGNVAFQYGLNTVGLAIGPPLTFAVLIVTGGILGWFWLREPVTLPAALGIGVLIVSIVFLQLSVPAAESASPVVSDLPWYQVGLGVIAVSGAGVAYAILGAAIRWGALRGVATTMSVLIVGAVGVVSLGIGSLAQVGPATLLATPPGEFGVMLVAGLCNAGAFLLLGRALELAPVGRVNAVNSSQVAMSTLVGVIAFHEPATYHLYLGILLMVAGLWLINREPAPRSKPVDLLHEQDVS